MIGCIFLFRLRIIIHFYYCRVWHPGFYEDGLLILHKLRKKYPHSKLFLAGFSAGSNIVQNILVHNNKSEEGKIIIAGAFCCCVNYCYMSTMRRLENGSSLVGKFYSIMLAAMTKVTAHRCLCCGIMNC